MSQDDHEPERGGFGDHGQHDRVRPEIRELIKRGNVTPAEVAELRCNSWEWEALVPALNDEAFIERMEHALENCFTRRERPFTTYNQAVEGLYAPELLKRFRFAARAARDFEETIDNVREALGQDETHYLIIADDVKDLVDAIEKDTVEHAEYVRRRRLGELVVPIDECESTRVLCRLRENGMYRAATHGVHITAKPVSFSTVGDRERICEFCGCHTNAHQRRCCEAGAEADRKS